MRIPSQIRSQVISHAFGEKNVAGIAAVHDALREIDSGTGNVRPVVYVQHLLDRTAVDPHAQMDLWMRLQCLSELRGTADWSFRVFEENQNHSVTGRQTEEF